MEEEGEEAWETLDLDEADLDIPFLRPCKRHNISQPSSSKPSSPSPPLIPGPAGAVQAAMNRRRARNDHEEDPIPTQDYIKRLLQNGDVHHDEDFAANPWLSALDFLRKEGMVDGNCAIPGTPLSSIKNGFHTDRVSLVVAIIKSCTPNGFGDLMVTLKDPTGTMDASIHRKVFSEGEFGKIISTGAVLVLHKVVVFTPSRSGYYLNITLNNVVKVISKDSGLPMKQNYGISSLRYAAESSESSKKSHMPQALISQERTEGIMNNLRKSSELRGNAHSKRVMEDPAVLESCFFSDENCKNPISRAGKESAFMNQVMANGSTNTVVIETNGSTNTVDIESARGDDQVIVTDEQPNLCKAAEGDSIQATNATENLVAVCGTKEMEMASRTSKQKQLIVSRTSVPEWTDEQLDELFAFDD